MKIRYRKGLWAILLMAFTMIALCQIAWADSGFVEMKDGATAVVGEPYTIKFVPGYYSSSGSLLATIRVYGPDGKSVVDEDEISYKTMYETIEVTFTPEKTGIYKLEGYCSLRHRVYISRYPVEKSYIATDKNTKTMEAILVVQCKTHTYGEWTVTKEADCKNEGQRKHTCSVCEKEETEVIPKTENHVFGEWTVTKEADCKDEGEKKHICSVCGYEETEAILKTENHVWGDWAETRKATTSSEGEEQRTCTVCGKTETRSTARLKEEKNEQNNQKEPEDNNKTNTDVSNSEKTQTEENITIPKAPASVKVKAKKNKVTVSWKKIGKKDKNLKSKVKAIRVQYSTDPKFKKNVVNKNVGKNKTSVVLKLQNKKTYYIRIRYVGKDGSFSKWSSVKRVKMK